MMDPVLLLVANERTPILGGGVGGGGGVGSSNNNNNSSSAILFNGDDGNDYNNDYNNDDDARCSPPSTKYRTISMIIASSLLVISAAFHLGVVAINNNNNNNNNNNGKNVGNSGNGNKINNNNSNVNAATPPVVASSLLSDDLLDKFLEEASSLLSDNDDEDNNNNNNNDSVDDDIDIEIDIEINNIKLLFNEFMIKYNKSYKTKNEKKHRMKIFEQNVNIIDKHNNNNNNVENENDDMMISSSSKKLLLYKLGINKFTDMTYNEIPKGFNKNGHSFGSIAHNQYKDTTSHLFSNVRSGSGSGSGSDGDGGRDASYTTATSTASVVSSGIGGIGGGGGGGGRKLRSSSSSSSSYASYALPKSVDWRTVKTNTGSPVTTPVKNQGMCGSCWAFAATAVLESHIAIATNTLFALSPQEFVSCSPNPNNCGGTGGCMGSTGELAYDYVAKHGIVTEWSDGYTSYHGDSGICALQTPTPEVDLVEDSSDSDSDSNSNEENDDEHANRRDSNEYDDDDEDDDTVGTAVLDSTGTEGGYLIGAVASIVGFSSLPTNSYDSLMYAVAMIGPVVVSVAANYWGMYRSGIFDDSSYVNHYDINHAVVLEGYGTDKETGEDYWLVRNSWGATWGENGYIRLKRNDPSTLKDPMSICKTDITPTHGVACVGQYQNVTPPVELACGTSGILYANVIPIGAHLL